VPDDLLDSLADSVAGGDRVDWQLAKSRLRSDNERAIAAQLQSISQLGPQETGRRALDGAARLPLVLELAAIVAILFIPPGLIGLWLGNPPVDVRLVALTAGVVIFSAAAVWLWAAAGSVRRARALSATYWSVAVSFVASGVSAIAHLRPHVPILVVIAALRPEAMLPAFLWQFVREFPAVARFSRLDAVMRAAQTIATAVGLFLVVANLWPALTESGTDSALWPFSRGFQNGRWFWVITFAMTVPALLLMAVRARDAASSERSRVRLFLASIAFGILPVALEVIAEGVFADYGRYRLTSEGRRWGALIVYGPLFTLPLLTVSVLLVHDVLDVGMAVRRGLRYVLARGVLAWGTALPIAFLGAVLYVHRAEPASVILATPPARVLAWFAGIGVALLAFRQPILALLDRLMAADVQDPSAALARLGEQLHGARTILEIARALAHSASGALKTDAEVYLAETNGVLTRAEGSGRQASADSLIPVLARGIGGPFVIASSGRNTYRALLNDSDREWIADVGTTAICPIVLRTAGVPDALITLNRRRSALGFSRADMQFLAAACGAAALAGQRLTQPAVEADAREELGLHCLSCRRVFAWAPGLTRCDCGSTLTRAALPVTIAGRFHLAALLGVGGMGVAYRARDLQLDRVVAVKTLPALASRTAEQLIAEARAMAALTHPRIAVVYSVEKWRGTPVLVVEYLPGGTLAQRLADGPIDRMQAFAMMAALARALAYMNAKGYSHGDIKTSNIAFAEDGTAKFLDFGLSRGPRLPTDADDAARGGTLAYMSPEAIAQGSSGPGDDVWALSVVLAECLSGVHPFLDGASTVSRIRAGAAAALGLDRVTVDDRTLLETLLDPSFERRPATAEALADLLAPSASPPRHSSY
jgi:hypothetical protein